MLTLAGPGTAQKILDADILVEVGPMDSLAATDEPPMVLFRNGAVRQAWIPLNGHGDAAPVG
ncbi:hypothetical protein D3C83_174370 [compost metagenome]